MLPGLLPIAAPGPVRRQGLARLAANHRQKRMASSPPVFRFAPSPNGRLHLGHAYSALLNQRLAGRFGGELLLRIEDIDLTRCRYEFEQGIYDDLAWLGISFPPEVRRQSRHFDDYRRALGTLDAMGLVYPCFCSRQQVKEAVGRCEAERGMPWPRDPDGAPLYPGTCRDLSEAEARRRRAAGEPHVLRLAMDRALARMAGAAFVYRLFDETGAQRDVTVDPAGWGDVVLARKDVPTSYHISVVVDDALQRCQPCRSRAGSGSGDRDPCPAATPARPADAALSFPSAAERRNRAEAGEEPAVPEPRRSEGGRGDAGGDPAAARFHVNRCPGGSSSGEAFSPRPERSASRRW